MANFLRRFKVPVITAVAFGSGMSYDRLLTSTGGGEIFPFNMFDGSIVRELVSSSTPAAAVCEAPMPGFIGGGSIMNQIGYPGRDNVRFREGYVLQYDTKHRTAHWVCERLTKESLSHKNAKRAENFAEDTLDNPLWRAKLSDYKRSGFDRGHLAPAADHKYSQKAMDDTFYLSNMSPQVGEGFNRDYWADLENMVRNEGKKHAETYVFTGPLYLSHREADGKNYVKYQVIGATPVAVPTHFFKIILTSPVVSSTQNPLSGCNYRISAYILPNAPIDSNIPFAKFKVPLQEVERHAGFLFFDKLGEARYKHQ